MPAVAQRGTVRESAMEVDSGRKIPCCTGDSNLRQYYTGLWKLTLGEKSLAAQGTQICVSVTPGFSVGHSANWAIPTPSHFERLFYVCLLFVSSFICSHSFLGGFSRLCSLIIFFVLLQVCVWSIDSHGEKPSDYTMTSVMPSGFLVAGCGTDCSVGVYYYGCMTLSGRDFTWWYMQLTHTIHWPCYIVWFCHSIRQHSCLLRPLRPVESQWEWVKKSLGLWMCQQINNQFWMPCQPWQLHQGKSVDVLQVVV